MSFMEFLITSYSKGLESLILFVPEFAGKIQNPSVHDGRYENFTVPSLQNCVGGDLDEMLLYSRQTVMDYYRNTSPLRPEC